MTILEKICEYKREELKAIKRQVPLADVQKKARDTAPALHFLTPLQTKELCVIAEVKKASPSRGVIRADFHPVDIALEYQEAGASALSVLTDEKFFQGASDYLKKIKERVTLPCLRKDFTLNEYHIFEARSLGADAVLLIAAILDVFQLRDYQALAWELGMEALIEVHDEAELDRVIPLNPHLIGVNNRNLKTFEVSLEVSSNLISKMPASCVRVSESGLKSHADLVQMHKAGYQAFLIGDSLLSQSQVGLALKSLLQGDPV